MENSWFGSSRLFETEDLHIIGDHMFSIGVPVEMPDEFKLKVFAAAKSYMLGINSVDYILRRYGGSWDFDSVIDKDDVFVSKYCRMTREKANESIDYLLNIGSKPDMPNIFACSAAIMRLKNTFRGAIICIKNGMHFEAASLSRIIIEQLAWMSAIYCLDDFEQCRKLRPQSCITQLKKIIPEAGEIYGELSEWSHIHFEKKSSYVKIENNELAVYLYNFKMCLDNIILLIKLIDWLEIVGEYIYDDLVVDARSTALNYDGKREIMKDRKMLNLIRIIKNDIEDYLEYKKSMQ